MKIMKNIVLTLIVMMCVLIILEKPVYAQSLEETAQSIRNEIDQKQQDQKIEGITEPSVGGTEVGASVIYYSDKADAAKAVRREMVKRQNTIQIGIKLASDLKSDQEFSAMAKWIENIAYEHTKAPDEGDYIKHQISRVEISGSYKENIYDSLYPHYYTITYKVDYITNAYQESQVESTANAIFQGFKDRGYDINRMSDYEKIETLYGYLVYTVTNDKDYDSKSDGQKSIEHSAYSAICNHISMCSGYTLALYYLLNKAGINTRYISGYGMDARHAWNIARLNGKYYYLDATWDAEASQYKDDLQYFLLGKNNAMFNRYHTADSEYRQSDFTEKYSISNTDYSDTADQHTVHLDPSGETNINEVIFKEYTVTNGKTYGDYIPFSITMKGYRFLGWYTQKTGGSKIDAITVINLLDDQTLYAHWEPVSYRISFDACGGYLAESYRIYTGYARYGTLPEPTAPSYKYKFEGWYTAPKGSIGYLIKSDELISFEDHTIYARWIDLYEIDTDNDGLSDGWEMYGADVDGDGKVDIDLPAMHADPNRPDVFVEVDWMQGLKPPEEALYMVVESFAKHNINLHIDVGVGSKNYYIDPVTGKLRYSLWDSNTSGGEEVPYSKNLYIGHEKANANGAYTTEGWESFAEKYFAKGRESVFKYCAFINRWNDEDATGIANNCPAQFFLVCDVEGYLRGYKDGKTQDVANIRIAGTFMHELGHTLGLRHGGQDDTNNKPNYLSVMNYSFQTNGYVGINYSDYSLPDLYEWDLDEIAGIDPFGQTKGKNIYTCWSSDNFKGRITTIGWIDFNNDGVLGKGVSADINGDGCTTVLRGNWNDWQNLVFKSYGIGKTNVSLSDRFPAGVSVNSEIFEELTVTEAEEMEKKNTMYERSDSVKIPEEEISDDELHVTQTVLDTDAAEKLQVTLDKSSYAVTEGNVLTVQATVSTDVKYESGSHAYIAYFAYMKKGSWEQLGGWYVDGGTSRYTLKQKITNWENYGNNLFVFSIFPVDNFVTGGSLSDSIFAVNVSRKQITDKTDKPSGDDKKTEPSVPENKKPAPVTPRKTSIANARVSGMYNFTYNGKPQKQNIDVIINGIKLVKNKDYTVAYRNNQNAGTAKIIITGKNLYTGKLERTYEIYKRDIQTASISNIKTKIYTGKAVGQVLNIKVNGRKLKAGTDYRIKYKKNVKPGTATMIIQAKGNYKGKIVRTFRIKLKKPEIKAVKTKKKTVIVKWKKQNTAITGYKLQYSKDKNFKTGVKNKTVKRKGSTSVTLTKLKSGQIYYVRIRTYKQIGLKKYYSKWSKRKKIQVK